MLSWNLRIVCLSAQCTIVVAVTRYALYLQLFYLARNCQTGCLMAVTPPCARLRLLRARARFAATWWGLQLPCDHVSLTHVYHSVFDNMIMLLRGKKYHAQPLPRCACVGLHQSLVSSGESITDYTHGSSPGRPGARYCHPFPPVPCAMHNLFCPHELTSARLCTCVQKDLFTRNLFPGIFPGSESFGSLRRGALSGLWEGEGRHGERFHFSQEKREQGAREVLQAYRVSYPYCGLGWYDIVGGVFWLVFLVCTVVICSTACSLRFL